MVNELVFYYPEGHEMHFEPGHPERPERIEAIRTALLEAGWWDAFPKLEPQEPSGELIRKVHDKDYIENLYKSCMSGLRLDADTYTTTSSYQLALNSAGGALSVANSVWIGESRAGLALTRPPGHHATRRQGMGFCLLNNIAIATNYLLNLDAGFGSKANRLAIVDIDLHHGNGTQDIFWERDDVFFFSTHQSPLYPGTGQLKETGGGKGEGYTANFPLPPGTGDTGFRAVFEELVIPLLDKYMPEMLLLSIGFDPHWRDPLGHLVLSAEGFGRIIKWMVDWAGTNCQGRIALFLEGGYDLEAAAACLQAAVAALLGEEWNDYLGPPPRSEGNSWIPVVREARNMWRV